MKRAQAKEESWLEGRICSPKRNQVQDQLKQCCSSAAASGGIVGPMAATVCCNWCSGPVLRSLLSSEWWLFTEYFLCPGYCTLSIFKTILHGGFCYSGCIDEGSEAYIDLRYKPKPRIVALCPSVSLNFRIYGTEIARQGKSTHLLHFPPCPLSSASTSTFHIPLSIFLLSHLHPSPKPSSIDHSHPYSHQFWSRTDHTVVALKIKKEP